MLEYLKQLDIKILLAINGLHTPFLDKCMLVITHRYTWIPLYLFILGFLFVKKEKKAILPILFMIAAIVSSDLFASSLMKPLFLRLRPCHNAEVSQLLYLIEDVCGGRYGFISSHAANTFAFVTFLLLYIGNEYKWVKFLFAWSILVSVSRVYLGVHYPADVTAGALAGSGLAWIFYYLLKITEKNFLKIKTEV